MNHTNLTHSPIASVDTKVVEVGYVLVVVLPATKRYDSEMYVLSEVSCCRHSDTTQQQ